MGPGSIRIYEVSPRDGLQNEACVVPTASKAALIARLVDAGCNDVEVTSFVRSGWIPQLADAAQLVAMLPRREGVRYWGLVPNTVGIERLIQSGLSHAATFMSASETHNLKNLNRTIRESLAGLDEVITCAKAANLGVRSYISTVFGCPYEGPVAPDATLRIAERLLAAGADEIVLGDTVGLGDPRQVERIVEVLTGAGIGLSKLSVHFHDTRGTALANALTAWNCGITTFDGSVAGLGGCPYAPGASGNAATEDLVHLFGAMGVDTGVNLEKLCEAGGYAAEILGRELPGRVHLAWRGAQARASARKVS